MDTHWKFRREGEAWEAVFLPHSPFVADLDGRDHWHGKCEYMRILQAPAPAPGSRYALRFGAAMHTAKVFIDGNLAGSHEGGYLPFEVDVTAWLSDGAEHELRVALDNGRNPDVPPGKPYEELDFCYYGGLYRPVELRVYPSIHITDPVDADAVASGGVFIRTEEIENGAAKLSLGVHVCSLEYEDRSVRLRYIARDASGTTVCEGISPALSIAARSSIRHAFFPVVENPLLWSIAQPHLHTMTVEILDEDGAVIDRLVERFGIRRIEISRSGGMRLNGERIRPMGVNRHQDYPRIGYALSDAAQYREAKRIKEAGFDYVRLSHYPQSPAFLDACDELGIVVMNCIPGWQFIGGEAFQDACYRNARELIRRDRNHPCVVLWELSLNETQMPEAFMESMMRIGHEEYPGDQMYVCGWIDRFDVFIHSRQHGQIHTWANGDKALVVAEYGDWEFYASTGGFDQKDGLGLLADWSNSRAFRGGGERRLRQQVTNHIQALNDVLASPAVCDGLWSMYDYPRGYNPTRAACGIMDVYRLPKYSYFFYRSQRSPAELGVNWNGGPMVYIASRWVGSSYLDVLVFSNCEKVELRLNGETVGMTTAQRSSQTQCLAFPPFVFALERFVPGRLEATGFIGGKPVASHSVATPGDPVGLSLSVDDEGVVGSIDAGDTLFAHARIVDEQGVICKLAFPDVEFAVAGDARIVGPKRVRAESGVASVVIARSPGCARFKLEASSPKLLGATREYETQASARSARAGSPYQQVSMGPRDAFTFPG